MHEYVERNAADYFTLCARVRICVFFCMRTRAHLRIFLYADFYYAEVCGLRIFYAKVCGLRILLFFYAEVCGLRLRVTPSHRIHRIASHRSELPTLAGK